MTDASGEKDSDSDSSCTVINFLRDFVVESKYCLLVYASIAHFLLLHYRLKLLTVMNFFSL